MLAFVISSAHRAYPAGTWARAVAGQDGFVRKYSVPFMPDEKRTASRTRRFEARVCTKYLGPNPNKWLSLFSGGRTIGSRHDIAALPSFR